MVAEAKLKAKEFEVGTAIAIVDDGGYLIRLKRIDDYTMVTGSNMTIGKAATEVGFKRPVIVLEKTVKQGRFAMQRLLGVKPSPFVPLMGACPIEMDGAIAGGITVAGAENGKHNQAIVLYASNEFQKK